jgi:hypothetical protein
MGRSPSGMSEVSITGDARYAWGLLFCLECVRLEGSEPVIGAYTIRGVRGRRPLKEVHELRPLLTAGRPSADATSGVSSGVAWRVTGV